MSSETKYAQTFMDAFGIQEEQLAGLKYQDIDEWDSIGHMNLMAAIEDCFDIEMDIDDITDFSGYEAGKAILRKYEVEIQG
jgi:acyl carrier protein